MGNNKPVLFIMLLVFSFCCKSEPYQQGKNLFTFYCENCHMADGSGLAKLIPPISKDFISGNRTLLPCIVKHGLKGPIQVNGIEYDQEMAGFSHLSDAEISNIVNYILHKWAPGSSPLLPGDVTAALASCPEQTK